MTTETYQQPEVATVQGAGPYTIPHEYHAASEISVTVTVATVKTTLTQAAEYTVAPAADATAGAVTLTAATAAQYAGAELRIIRRTVNEQGYAAQGGEREAGLEVQLDRQTRGIQDLARDVSALDDASARSLRMPSSDPVIAALPVASARANRIQAYDATGAPMLYNPAIALTVADAGIPVFGTALAAGLATVPAGPAAIMLLGMYAPGDGGLMVMVRRASEPSHLAKLQTADGQWWETIEPGPLPQHFGARWDGTTDDTAAINAWAAYLRATNRSGRLPPGMAYCAGTLYLGGVNIVGAGGPTNAGAFTSKTVIKSNGNPMLSMAYSATSPANYFLTHWQDFTVLAAGGAVATINLWDYLNYPYQVGVWAGRNHNFMMRTTDTGGSGEADQEETGQVGGSGGLTMLNMCVQDASGWGVYAYKLWGKSLIHNVFTRRCGGVAAFTLSNDRFGGAYNFASECVDFRVGAIHAYNSGYANAAHSYRGTGIRIGGYKTVVEGLDRLAQNGTNQLFDAIHLERFRIPLEINNTGDVQIGGGSISGPPALHGTYGKVYIGHGSNRGNDVQGSIGPLKCFNVDRVFVMQPGFDLGGLVNREGGLEMQIHTWVGVKWSSTGADTYGMGSTGQNVKLVPRYDPADMPGGIGSRVAFQVQPFFNTAFKPGTDCANLLRQFARGGGALENWTHDGTGTATAGARFMGATAGGAKIHHDAIDTTAKVLVPGEIMTLQVWAELAGTNALSNLTFGLADLTGTEIVSWPMGPSGDEDANTVHHRFVSLIVPTTTNANGHTGVRVFFKSLGANIVRWRHPILCPGSLRSMGAAPLNVWNSYDGAIVCSGVAAPAIVIPQTAAAPTSPAPKIGQLAISDGANSGFDGTSGAGLYRRGASAWIFIG